MWRRLNKRFKQQTLAVAVGLALTLGLCAISEAAPRSKRQHATGKSKINKSENDNHKTDKSETNESEVNKFETDKPDEAAPQASAEDDRLEFMAAYERKSDAEQPSGFGALARTLGALLLIVGLLVGSVWCLRRLKGSPLGASREEARLNVVTTISIGDRRSLTVVRFGERTLLVGSTPQSFTLLASDDNESLLPFSLEESSPRSVADVLNASEGREINPSSSFAAELEHLEAWKNREEGAGFDKENW